MEHFLFEFKKCVIFSHNFLQILPIGMFHPSFSSIFEPFYALFDFWNLIGFCLSYRLFKIFAIFKSSSIESRFATLSIALESSDLAQMLVIYVQTTPEISKLMRSMRDGFALLVNSLLKMQKVKEFKIHCNSFFNESALL